MQMESRVRIQAEGSGSPIGDGTPYNDMVRWVEAGAVNQCSTDSYLVEGLTHSKRFLDYAEERGNLVINLRSDSFVYVRFVFAHNATFGLILRMDIICPW